MAFFRKNKKPNIVDPGNAARFNLSGFELSYERQQQPDPGIPSVSYETLQLPPYTPIGAGVRTRQPIVPTAIGAQFYGYPGVLTTGLPIVTGYIVRQPLFNGGV